MTQAQRAGIQELASKVLGILYPTGIQFPVEPNQIVPKLGGNLKYDPLDSDVYAEIHRTEEGFEVALLPGQPITRERFTLAHELGHLFLHMGFLDPETWKKSSTYLDGAFRRTEGDYSHEELEANEFAASLLMPTLQFKAIAEENYDPLISAYKIPAIAGYFGVSKEAAINRGRWLRLFSWD